MHCCKTNLWTMAVPVFDRRENVIAAASVIIPREHTDRDNIKYLGIALKGCAEELSSAINQLE